MENISHREDTKFWEKRRATLEWLSNHKLTIAGSILSILIAGGFITEKRSENRKDAITQIALQISSDKEKFANIYSLTLREIAERVSRVYNPDLSQEAILKQLQETTQ